MQADRERTLLRRHAQQALRFERLPLLLAAGLLAGFHPAQATGPAQVVSQIRSTRLDPSRAVAIRSVEIEFGPALFDIERGVLIPALTRDGRVTELAFIGQARFRIEPPDEIEADQLELFTGQRSLDAAVESAIFVVANANTVDRLLDGPAPREMHESLLVQAEELHKTWLLKTERRNTGVESAIFKSHVGDEAFRDYFAIWANSHELGPFVYQLDPEDVEQITLASFQPLDVRGWERQRLKREIRIQQRKGHWLNVRLEDLGAWDLWLSSEWEPEGGPAFPANVGFEAEHYEIDLTITRGDRRLEGVARLELITQTSGRRAVPLDLFRDLVVTSVVDGKGRKLFFFRSGKEVVVHLPEPSKAGEKLTLVVTYGGKALKWVGRKSFDLEDTASWHPHCGTIDRASYDVTLRWPKKFDLLASGRLVGGGQEGGYRWERRRLDQPSIAFSFVLGDYLIDRKRFGHIDVTAAFNSSAPARLNRSVRSGVMETVGRSLAYFEQTFGPYPLDHLTVVTLPRKFSQSYLGFLALSDNVLLGSEPSYGLNLELMRDTTIAHEIAHQWWGNVIGWWSYRDQWLSEAMANFSALLYYTHQEGEGSTFLADMSAGWRESLSQTTFEGRTIESLGPVVLGGRLNSSKSGGAYRAIIYRKGAVVLAMLARALGQREFLEMLRSLADAAAQRVLTTDGFIRSLERMSGIDLQGFARQFIYGSGIPQVYYTYGVEPGDDGEWTLRGEARLLADPSFGHQVVRTGDGRWDVRRVVERPDDSIPTALMVPFRLTLADEPGLTSAMRRRNQLRGQLFIRGERDDFEIQTQRQPGKLELDPEGEVLARFYSVDRHRKRGLRYRAQDLMLDGKLDMAEAAYREALDHEAGLPPATDPASWIRDRRTDGRTEDTTIRLSLARLYLDQGQTDRAETELDAVEELLDGDKNQFRMARDSLRSRLEIQRGEYRSAFKRLKKTLRMAAPRHAVRTWRARAWQSRLTSERLAMTDAYVLLAVAAHETGQLSDLQWAIEGARGRGADLSALLD